MRTRGMEDGRDPLAGLVGELEGLEVEERELSDRRADLHRQIDEVYLRAPLNSQDIALLDRLEALERRLSAERRNLHGRIDRLRVAMGRPPGPTPRVTSTRSGSGDSGRQRNRTRPRPRE